jgi:hypothetical protein
MRVAGFGREPDDVTFPDVNSAVPHSKFDLSLLNDDQLLVGKVSVKGPRPIASVDMVTPNAEPGQVQEIGQVLDFSPEWFPRKVRSFFLGLTTANQHGLDDVVH